MVNNSFNFNNGSTNVEKATVISIFSFSGGSGKSTIASNLAYELSNLGKKILLIDTDLNCVESYMFKIDFDEDKSIYRAIINYNENYFNSIFNYIQDTIYKNLDIITNDMDIFQVEHFLTFNKNSVIKKIMEPLINEYIYDFIIIDCSSSLGMLNKNILSITNKLIVPVELTASSFSVLVHLCKFINKIKVVNKDISIGILKNKVDINSELTIKGLRTLEACFRETAFRIFDTFIPEDILIPESQQERLPLSLYNELDIKNCKSKNDFKALAYETMFYI